ncbi:helix-turn-helix domain-containing protein [Salsuginibacillus kocurii]|uniref:helix-turn-helix domain-containing protein n=1 Tax=Salsuginibacillus kocurii TaxID=427078 RepID=UPI00035CDC09|nr:helix-turn-helix domain-containing protein [Salsuginibacillus kocurii]
MYIRELGAEIAYLRKKNKLTQTDLAKNICTQPTISMIEKGEIVPGIDTLHNIALRLNKPVEYFLKVLEYQRPEYVEQTINLIEKATTAHDYETVYRLTSAELESGALNNNWIKVFLKWHQTTSGYELGKWEAHEAEKKLIHLLEKLNEIEGKKEGILSKIYNTLGILCSEQNKFTESRYYYDKSITHLPEISDQPSTRSLPIFYLRVLYNKTITLYDAHKYEESLAEAERGIYWSKIYDNMALIGQFYYYKGQNSEILKLNTEAETKECYRKALFFFKLLNKNVYESLLLKHKGHYLE